MAKKNKKRGIQSSTQTYTPSAPFIRYERLHKGVKVYISTTLYTQFTDIDKAIEFIINKGNKQVAERLAKETNRQLPSKPIVKPQKNNVPQTQQASVPKSSNNTTFAKATTKMISQAPPEFNESSFKKEFNNLTGIQQSYPTSKDIYIGLDFGTSYTKVAYHLDNNNKGNIRFGDSVFKPSVVYLDEQSQSISLFRDAQHNKEIRYFKATLRNDKTKYEELRYHALAIDSQYKDHFEFLCATFFIANILNFVKKKLSERYKSEISLYTNMGVPILFNKDAHTEYNQVLHCAISLVDTKQVSDIMKLGDLFMMHNNALGSFSNDLYDPRKLGLVNCTMPEVFAEAMYLISKNTYGNGYYLIVDVGGGTTDFAFLQKDPRLKNGKLQETNINFNYNCLASDIATLGAEVRHSYATQQYDGFWSGCFSEIAIYGKRRTNKQIGYLPVQILLFGGGVEATNNCYTRILKDEFVKLKQNTNLDCQMQNKLKKQRLIISEQLSNPLTRTEYRISLYPDAFKDPNPPAFKPDYYINKGKAHAGFWDGY